MLTRLQLGVNVGASASYSSIGSSSSSSWMRRKGPEIVRSVDNLNGARSHLDFPDELCCMRGEYRSSCDASHLSELNKLKLAVD